MPKRREAHDEFSLGSTSVESRGALEVGSAILSYPTTTTSSAVTCGATSCSVATFVRQRQNQRERRTLAWSTVLENDTAAVHFDQLTDQRQSDPQTVAGGAHRLGCLGEHIEN